MENASLLLHKSPQKYFMRIGNEWKRNIDSIWRPAVEAWKKLRLQRAVWAFLGQLIQMIAGRSVFM